MEKRVELNLLLDFYGALLTPHRCEIVRLYVEEDMSLQEIAETFGISRQAVHDSIVKSEAQLTRYEEKLGLLGRFKEMKAQIADCRRELESAKASIARAEEILGKID